jgi:glycosyltransferase involved in cell wall biosynthesis
LKINKGVSVVISTFNGSQKLWETLKHLAAQKTGVPWEIILVDNASTDNTQKIAEQIWDEVGNKEIPFRTFFQPIPGKSHAQDMGYGKATYEYILIVDDDNWLCDTYVQTAYEIMEEHPGIGGLGGWCEAVFEAEKPAWFDLFAHNFAVSRQGEESGDITGKKGCLYGAGMVIRKSHWLELKEKGFAHQLTCRKGNSLSSGGDTEYSYALRLQGYKIWFDERLYFKHFMPAARMDFNYLKRLRKAMSESEFALLAYLHELSNTPAAKTKYTIRLLKEIKRYLPKTLKWYFKGDLLQKEEARSRFRRWYWHVTGYKLYADMRSSIQEWTRNSTNHSA